MSDENQSHMKNQRPVFKSTTTLLDSPPEQYKEQWPKKPHLWRVHGTVFAKRYWQITACVGALTCVVGGLTYLFRKHLAFDYLDRLISPEKFEPDYKGFSMDFNQFLHPDLNKVDPAFFDYGRLTRPSSSDESTKDLRKWFESPAGHLANEVTGELEAAFVK